MLKEQITEFAFSLKHGPNILFAIRASANGFIHRIGSGVDPNCDFIATATLPKSQIFQDILRSVPDHLPETNLMGSEIPKAGALEYTLNFNGGEKLDSENWEFMSGLRIVVQPDSDYQHPLLPITEAIGKAAEEASSLYYLNSMICYCFGACCYSLPENAVYSGPAPYSERQKLWADYLETLQRSGKLEQLLELAKKEVYFDAQEVEYKLDVAFRSEKFFLQLIPVGVKISEKEMAMKKAVSNRNSSMIGMYQRRLSKGSSVFTSIGMVFFILMLACIVYLTFYL